MIDGKRQLGDFGANAFGDLFGHRAIRVRHHHHELLAAKAAGKVDAAHILAQPPREFAQHLIAAMWGESETGRRVKIYSLTRAGKKRLHTDHQQWRRATSIVERFFKILDQDAS